jgi:hypothetical protein
MGSTFGALGRFFAGLAIAVAPTRSRKARACLANPVDAHAALLSRRRRAVSSLSMHGERVPEPRPERLEGLDAQRVQQRLAKLERIRFIDQEHGLLLCGHGREQRRASVVQSSALGVSLVPPVEGCAGAHVADDGAHPLGAVREREGEGQARARWRVQPGSLRDGFGRRVLLRRGASERVAQGPPRPQLALRDRWPAPQDDRRGTRGDPPRLAFVTGLDCVAAQQRFEHDRARGKRRERVRHGLAQRVGGIRPRVRRRYTAPKHDEERGEAARAEIRGAELRERHDLLDPGELLVRLGAVPVPAQRIARRHAPPLLLHPSERRGDAQGRGGRGRREVAAPPGDSAGSKLLGKDDARHRGRSKA